MELTDDYQYVGYGLRLSHSLHTRGVEVREAANDARFVDEARQCKPRLTRHS